MIGQRFRQLLTPAAILLATTTAAAAQDVSLTGVVYSQYAYLLSGDRHDNDFDVTRAYLNVLGSFDHGINTRVTGDVYRNDDGSLGYRLKYAFVTYTPESSPLTFKFGQIHTPWVDWEEALWDYRMQGPIALDRAGYLTSSDLGVGVDGAWSENAFNFQVALVNGEGYNHRPGDKNKDLEARASIRLARTDDMGRTGGVRLTGYAHVGERTGGGERNRWVGMLSYDSRAVTVAGEFAATADGAGDEIADLHGTVISGYAVARIPASPWAVIGRVDVVDPDTDTDDDGYTTFIGGVSYQLTAKVRLLADIDHFRLQAPVDVGSNNRTLGLFQVQFAF